MTLWAIVPVKPLLRSKSRLAEVMSQEDRATLSQDMLIHTLRVLAEVPQIERTLVVSRDPRALSLARDHGARTVSERGSQPLNAALLRASLVAKGYGVSAVLVLPADLPLLRREDVESLVTKARNPPVMVIAPDRHRSGTNALLCSPVGLIEYDFGPDSFNRHMERGRRAKARIEVCDTASLTFDLDAPEDLEIYRNTEPLVDLSGSKG